MNKTLLLMPMTALTLLLTGCPSQSKVDGGTDTPQAYTNEASTQDTSTMGRDANQNNIRDDIDALIQAKYGQSTAQTSAAQALARELQKTATTDAPTVDQAIAQFQKTTEATYCLTLLTNEADETNAAQRLAGATFNTVDRMKNLEKQERLASGTAFTLPRNAACYN